MSIWGAQFGRLAVSMFAAAAQAARRAILAFLRFLWAFANLILDAGVHLAWWVYVLLFLAVAIGVPSALVLTKELTGGGERAGSVAPAAAPAAVAPAAVSTPTAAPQPAAVAPTATTTSTGAALPTATAPAGANAAAPPPAGNAPAVPELITLRGTFDESALTGSELGPILKVLENSILLVLPRDGGPIGGSARVRLDNFPAGAILEQIYEGMGGSPDDYPDLDNCMSLVTLKADDIEGTYSPQTSSITGSAIWAGQVEDRPCLSSLPHGITTDEAVDTTQVTLTATFDGRQVVGVFSSESGELSFKATVPQ